MKPNFALSLSFDGIRLLHRQADGWGRVGDVDLSTEDLAGDLADLRTRAEALGSGPVQTKLIIPDEQIKYLTVDSSGLDKSSLHDAVLSALDGATPYAVDELAFDFATIGSFVHIAAVAKETLAEAEAFATDHDFAPLGFVAAPAAANFPKEPNFGPTALAQMQGAEPIVADDQPVFMTGEAMPVPPVPEAAPSPDTTGQARVEDASGSEAQQPLPGFASRRGEADAPTAVAPLDDTAGPVVPPLPPATVEPSNDAAPILDGAQRAADAPIAAPDVAPILPPARAAMPEPLAAAPAITGTPPAARDPSQASLDAAALRPGAATGFADAGGDDVPDMPAFVATRRNAPPAVANAASGMSRANIPRERDGPSAADRAAALAKGAGAAALAGATAGARKLFAKREKPAAEPVFVGEATTVASVALGSREDEKNRLTTFGARSSKKKTEPFAVGGKPRFLGMILTAILLLFLVSVAAWASVFLDEGIARFFGNDNRDRAIAELADPNQDAGAQVDVQLAALDDGIIDLTQEDGTGETGLTPIAPLEPALSPQEVEARYAATGIWQAAPDQPPLPRPIALSDVYIPSIDGKISGEDAIALLGPESREDARPEAGQAPAPAGTKFDFDERGFVRATPEGALTPEGAVVYSGRPAVVPPAIPQRLLRPDAPAQEEDVAQAEPEAPIVPSKRPKRRPETLVEDTEREQLGGNTRAELAQLRPKLRPRVEKQEEEEVAQTAPPTAQAVAASRKPDARPSNFARIVTRAQRNQQRQEQQQTTQVAAVAPRTVTPRIPSAASVSRAATEKNAINLSRVNLIGVYGKPSSRRALVRLSNGRYKKVKVGDRVDGGRVSAIGEAQLNYTKGGRAITLRMPKG